MSDTAALVERLRKAAKLGTLPGSTPEQYARALGIPCVELEAANTIERQQSELSSIRERTINECSDALGLKQEYLHELLRASLSQASSDEK